MTYQYKIPYKYISYEQYRISKVIYTTADEPEVLTTGGNDDMSVPTSKQNATSCSKTEKVRVATFMCKIIVSHDINMCNIW